MSKLTKIVIPVIVLLAIVGGYYLTKNKNTQIASGQIKVGVILPLTGDLASLGENAKNGAMLAYQNLSAEKQKNIQLLFEDDQFKPQNTVSAFNKLVDIDKVNIVICFTSGPCNAVAPLAEQKQVPLIAVASDPKIQRDKKFVVRLEIAPSEEAKQLLNHLQAQDYKRIASVVAVQDGIQAGYSSLKSDAWYSGREVYTDSVKPDEKDFRTVIIKALAQKPDVIFVGLLPGMAGEFGKQAKTFDYKGQFVGFNFLEGQETLDVAKGALDGIVYTNAQDPQSWFAEKYQAVYNKAYGEGAPHLFDAVSMIGQGLGLNKSNLDWANYLSSIKDFNGALGIYSSTDTHEFTVPVMLKTIKDNKFIPYK